MPKKSSRAKTEPTPIVQFELNRATYQIDPGKKKVYRRFVEIETSRAAEILSLWRARHASA